MGLTIYRCDGGTVDLPDRRLTLVSREDGGNLIVNPPREVWERSELSPAELTHWSFLIAAAGRAMLESLPQLEGGCINYWDAGNWALNEEAAPRGPKTAPLHRRVHMHLLGRSRTARSPFWRWGEAPRFPVFAGRHAWAAEFERLTPAECAGIARRIDSLLREKYALRDEQIGARWDCAGCGYPVAASGGAPEAICEECSPR